MSTNDIHAQLEEERRLIAEATGGPWEWGKESYDSWGDCGPNLETVERGPVYFDGSQGAKEIVVGSWGHDANGVVVDPADATFIAHARSALPLRNAQVEAVLALHQPHWDDLPWRRRQPDIPGCTECYDEGRPFQYPCPTVRAIEEAGND